MMDPELLISNEIIQKYIRGDLDDKESSALKQLLDSSASYALLGRILDACRHYNPSPGQSDSLDIITFEQIDNILLEFLSDKISEESLKRLLHAFDHEADFAEKLLTRIQSNVGATLDSAQASLSEIEMMSDEALLQKMGVTAAPEKETEIARKEGIFEKTVAAVADFFASLSIPKPAYYLVPVILIALFVSFESSLFFADRGIIDDYALENWQHYEVNETTLRSTHEQNMDPHLALVNSYRMALSSFITEDYKAAIPVFDNVIAYTEKHTDIPDDLKFDIYFMAGMSSLSFAMTDEATLDKKDSLDAYLNKSVHQFTEAKKYIESASEEDKDALHYHLGLGLVFQGKPDKALEDLKYIKNGHFYIMSEQLKTQIDKEN